MIKKNGIMELVLDEYEDIYIPSANVKASQEELDDYLDDLKAKYNIPFNEYDHLLSLINALQYESRADGFNDGIGFITSLTK